jgi:hypothetical protein
MIIELPNGGDTSAFLRSFDDRYTHLVLLTTFLKGKSEPHNIIKYHNYKYTGRSLTKVIRYVTRSFPLLRKSRYTLLYRFKFEPK